MIDISPNFILVKIIYYIILHKQYLGHRCDIPGCGEVLVLDGNMKNSHEVCYATHAGHAEFSGLAGHVQIGCPNTPAYKSRYCKLHAPITTTPYQVQFSQDGNPVLTNSSTSAEERQVAIITNKRVTRSSTYYQVAILLHVNPWLLLQSL